jgi:carbohydrate diacid regulator
MEYSPQLARALDDLKRITGLSLEVQEKTPEKMDAAARQIRLLCSAYRSKYDRDFFLLELLNGRIPSHNIPVLASQFHIPAGDTRVLFVLESSGNLEGIATEILKNLFPERNSTFLIPVNLHQIAILQTVSGKSKKKINEQTAYAISDTLSTEALICVKLSYSMAFHHLEDLPSVFQDCCTALKIGSIFYSGQSVYPCSKLGIGQLIYQLPLSSCERFLKEVFGEKIPRKLDDELLHSVDVFFKNNLNIAETARQLHMHRNTFIYRLEQLEKSTGLDLRNFEDALVFKIASMVISYLQTERST